MDAYANSKTPEEARDKRATPGPVFDAIRQHLNLRPTLDVCAEGHTAKCAEFFTEGALERRWTVADGFSEVCWMNPPYSSPYEWCKKAADEAQRGAIVIGLLPDDRSTKWFKEQVYPQASAIYTTNRRVSFLDENGEPQAGNPKGSIIPIWTPWEVDSPASGYIKIPRWNAKKREWLM